VLKVCEKRVSLALPLLSFFISNYGLITRLLVTIIVVAPVGASNVPVHPCL
jgi:hypothetical protein